jgi:hypothetical protein
MVTVQLDTRLAKRGKWQHYDTMQVRKFRKELNTNVPSRIVTDVSLFTEKPMLFCFQRSPSRAATTDTPAPDPRYAAIWEREGLLTLLSVLSTLAGLCITGVSLIHHANRHNSGTLADDGLAFSALLFLLCTYAIFFALRTRHAHWAHWLDRLVDALFVLALTSMVVCGFIMVYTML